MIKVLAFWLFVLAYIMSNLCTTETSWLEYDGDYTTKAVCGDEDGNAL